MARIMSLMLRCAQRFRTGVVVDRDDVAIVERIARVLEDGVVVQEGAPVLQHGNAAV